uniref:Gamma-glutamyltranspeptidase n=1 Tax=Chromera velia CCMP2878 TaxID=1169474 RepID=A0A0G4FY36_9ALVE|eukprot:Cvel_19214.t1-p1 / transcript=Cvel_19214.t1 / gene=Cvel_19214 / organism=Chromera_velia_CCMP2878 / gene_product=hypothetical protein / transcript_product=hypothetical protein / location=Cvel_scaffold1641:10143-11763(-) / protein_length=509 / sequence_SO=supercontig / SO=protein_coding / is_pseudo=false
MTFRLLVSLLPLTVVFCGNPLDPSSWATGEVAKWSALNTERGPHRGVHDGRDGVVAGTSNAIAVHAAKLALLNGGSAADAAIVASTASIVWALGRYIHQGFVRQPEVAQLLEEVARDPRFIYNDPEFQREFHAISGASVEELQSYRSFVSPAFQFRFADANLYSSPAPPDYGGASLAERLHLIELFQISTADTQSNSTALAVSAVIEQTSLFLTSLMLRGLGSVRALQETPSFAPVFPPPQITGMSDFNHRRASLQHASRLHDQMATMGLESWSKSLSELSALKDLDRVPVGGGHSDHVAVIDREGGAVSFTHTLNALPYGSQKFLRGCALANPNVPGINNALLRNWSPEGAPFYVPTSLQPVAAFQDRSLLAFGSVGESLQAYTACAAVGLLARGIAAEDMPSIPCLRYALPLGGPRVGLLVPCEGGSEGEVDPLCERWGGQTVPFPSAMIASLPRWTEKFCDVASPDIRLKEGLAMYVATGLPVFCSRSADGNFGGGASFFVNGRAL